MQVRRKSSLRSRSPVVRDRSSGGMNLDLGPGATAHEKAKAKKEKEAEKAALDKKNDK